MTDPLDRNLEAVEGASPRAAALIRRHTRGPAVELVPAASGEPVLVRHGRALDSRRDPAGAGAREAAGDVSGGLAIAGLGSGYLLAALRDRGADVRVVVEPDLDTASAVLESRDLSRELAGVRFVVGPMLGDPVELALARRRAPRLVTHAPSVQAHAELAALAERWPTMPVSPRPPRVLVVGPIDGGSLGVARSTARALAEVGAEARLFDASIFGAAQAHLRETDTTPRPRAYLLERLIALASDTAMHEAFVWKPDLVVALAQAPLTRDALERLRKAAVPTAFWFVENGRVLTYWRDVAPLYDHFFAIQPGRFLDRLAESGARRPAYLPMACDPAVHQPVALTREERDRYGSDVSFAGARYVNRDRTMAALVDFDLKLWGPDWSGPVFGPRSGRPGHRFEPDEAVRIFAATRVNLNLHSATHVQGLDPEPDYVNPRTFELAACGAFQLVDWRDPLPELFRPDELVTFRSVSELRRLIAEYLSRDMERHETADRARRRVLDEHTYRHRAEWILRETLPPGLVAAALDPERPESIEEASRRLDRASAALTDDEALVRIVEKIGRP